MASRNQLGRVGAYNGGHLPVQGGGALTVNFRRLNNFAKNNKVVSKFKGVTDALGATDFIDKKTGGLYSKGANAAIKRGYGKRRRQRGGKKR